MRDRGGAAVDEEDGAAAEGAHVGQHLVHGGDGAVDGELDRAHEVGGSGLQDRPHEVLVRDRAVLQDLDRAQGRGRGIQGCREGTRIAYVGGESSRRHALADQAGGEGVGPALVAGDERCLEALTAEPPCGGRSEAGACSDDGHGGHDFLLGVRRSGTAAPG